MKSFIPRFMVATPRYSDLVVADSYMARVNAARNDIHSEEDHVDVVFEIGCHASLLAFCFNQMFAEALNKRDEGLCTHFAMLHSDVGAKPGWLNSLYSIMRERGDIVVSAVIPIKEPERERTSTAVGNRFDVFDIRRYITVGDRLAMPETFSIDDVRQDPDDVLLINTGMWVADLSWEGWDGFSFQINDTIMVNPATGKRQAFCEPEDWFMSRFLDSQGASYSGTWKVPVTHHGPSIWRSHETPAMVGKFAKSTSQE